MVTPSGRVKVLDFGVAERRRPPSLGADDSTRTANLTQLGSGFAGTVGYAAPEQLVGRAVDVRADLFSLGVMLYELVCGRRPFPGENAAQILEAILTGAPPPFPDPHRDPRLPALERLVRHLLAPERHDPPARALLGGEGDDRPASSVGLRAALEAIRTAGGRAVNVADDSRSVAIA